MGTCQTCGKSELLPFNCKFCGGIFCGEHRLPENHSCKKISAKYDLRCRKYNIPIYRSKICNSCKQAFCIKHRSKKNHDCNVRHINSTFNTSNVESTPNLRHRESTNYRQGQEYKPVYKETVRTVFFTLVALLIISFILIILTPIFIYIMIGILVSVMIAGFIMEKTKSSRFVLIKNVDKHNANIINHFSPYSPGKYYDLSPKVNWGWNRAPSGRLMCSRCKIPIREKYYTDTTFFTSSMIPLSEKYFCETCQVKKHAMDVGILLGIVVGSLILITTSILTGTLIITIIVVVVFSIIIIAYIKDLSDKRVTYDWIRLIKDNFEVAKKRIIVGLFCVVLFISIIFIPIILITA